MRQISARAATGRILSFRRYLAYVRSHFEFRIVCLVTSAGCFSRNRFSMSPAQYSGVVAWSEGIHSPVIFEMNGTLAGRSVICLAVAARESITGSIIAE